MKKVWMLMPVAAFLFSMSVARAQSGNNSDGPCDGSPENPTVILAALGSSGAGLAALRVRLRARKAKK